MRSALIGHTGLVGTNLMRHASFSDCFNSKNIEAIAGREFDLVVCAGAPAVKWLANREPAADWQNLQRLIQCLETIRTRQFVLISTVDVFPTPVEVHEYSPIRDSEQHPYGRHRYWLERFAAAQFPCTTIVRLPGLFGPGLKKNVIFDLLHNNNLHAIDARASFQFYNLDHLWSDVNRILAANLPIVHLATEPATVGEIADLVFNREFTSQLAAPPPSYDFRSCHAPRFGGSGGYLYPKHQVLQSMQSFVREARAVNAPGNLQSGVAA
jgi:nucleoside-diphosphate-sugar epimerase